MWEKPEHKAGVGESCLEDGSHERDERGGENGETDEVNKLKTPP